jgi:NADH-quinone oxidoreductase subunit A
MNHSFFPVLIFFFVALAVPLGALALARVWMTFFTPLKPGKDKQALYECGVNPLADRQTRFHSQYYMFGLLFLLFDVETVFLLPFAVAFLKLPWQAFAGAMLFLLLLAEGLLWAWSKGLLDWRATPKTQLTAPRVR